MEAGQERSRGGAAGRGARRLALAGLGAGLLCLALWVPWRGAGAGGALEGHMAWAATSVITGTVAWKGSVTPVGGVQVVLRDQAQGVVVAQATTDAQGAYLLAPGVGSWLVDVPSTDRYWGYAQTVVVMPHDTYHLDFGITVRPPAPPTPTAGPTQTPAPAATALPGGAPTAPGATEPPTARSTPGADTAGGRKLPAAGRPAPWLPASVWGLLAVLLVGLGRRLRAVRAAEKEGR